jgi:hypothetical protein
VGNCTVCFNVLSEKGIPLDFDQTLGISVEVKLYQETDKGVLRKVGETGFKKAWNSFECSFKSSDYVMFICFQNVSKTKAELDLLPLRIQFFGEARVSLTERDVVNTSNKLNAHTQFVEAEGVVIRRHHSPKEQQFRRLSEDSWSAA